MERESIYVEGDRATGAGAKSPRFISSGGLGAGTETPRCIIGGGSGSRLVAESRRTMQELILLGRNSGAHSEDLARIGEFQVRQSVVEGAEGRTDVEREKFWQLIACGCYRILGLNSSISRGWI